jgi:aspartate 1-decarboxylase
MSPGYEAGMLLTLMKAKIHRAAVTQADLEYEGSISIDATLLRESGILPYEQVHVYDVNNGNRFITYAIEAPCDTGTICVNGAAARLVTPGDKVIIVSYAQMTTDEARQHQPRVLLVNDKNQIKSSY